MKHFFKHCLLGIAGVATFAALCVLFGTAVMLLWNWLLPEIFGLPQINYWQAVALLVLARILFGGIGGGFHGGGRGGYLFGGFAHHSNPFREKWLAMTEEERKEFFTHHHDFFRGNSRKEKTQE